MAACDAIVSLRSPTMGETSGSAIRALSLGKPLVVSDVGWFAELPDDAVLKVPVDEREEDDAARRARGARRPGVRAAMGAARASSSNASTGSTASPRRTPPRSRARRRRRPSPSACCARSRPPRPRSGSTATTRPSSRRGCARSGSASSAVAVGAAARARSSRRPDVGLGRGPGRRLHRDPLRARPADRHALDHGRRAHLLRAREEPRRRRPLPAPRRAHRGVRPRLPGADRARRGRSSTRSRRRTRRRRRSTRSSSRCRRFRRTCSPGALLAPVSRSAAAVLAMAVPTLLYAGMLMTENAFYRRSCSPRSRCASGSSGPTAKRTPSCSARRARVPDPRAGGRDPAGARDRAVPRLRPARRCASSAGSSRPGRAASLLVVVVQLARGASVFGVFGAYEVAGTLVVHGVAASSHWLLYHWEELILSFGSSRSPRSSCSR